MAGLAVVTDAFVLTRRPSVSDSFQAFSVFSAEHGEMLVLQRIAKKTGAGASGARGGRDGSGASGGAGGSGGRGGRGGDARLDLFSEMALVLESANQGRTWFVREARVVRSAEGIGRDYETLRCASEFAMLIARNTIAAESRARVGALLREVFGAFADAARGGLADVIYIKAVYRFARGEGYPLKEQWFAGLPPAERARVAALINKPLAELSARPPEPGVVDTVRKKLEAYLRAQTEILVE